VPASPHCGDSQHSVAPADIRRKAFRRRYEFFVERSTYETQQLHEDTFLKILWDESPDAIGIDWKEATSSMTGEEFKKELTLFADRVEAKKAHGILVDVARFRHKPGPDMQEWRVKNISGPLLLRGRAAIRVLVSRESSDSAYDEPILARRKLRDARIQR
jgi:hypothetical protein